MAYSTPLPSHFILPDLVGHCTFPLTYHPAIERVNALSNNWLASFCPDFTPKQRAALHGLSAGRLTAFCYPYSVTEERLQVVSDFMNFLFHLDNISDGMLGKGTEQLASVVMNALWFPDSYIPAKGGSPASEECSAGRLARDYWKRCIKHAKPGPQARFKESLEMFFEAVHQQARDRDAGIVPDLESYIALRRDTSGCKPVFDLIEYAADIDLPDEVVGHPVVKALNQGTNDLVTWSNDIFSYSVEQARGDTHNMVVILMKYHGMDLQSAIDHVGILCKDTITTFQHNLSLLPSFGDPKLDRDVAAYVQGLQQWIVSSLHWSFMTKRYFGTDGMEIKRTRVVWLLPKRGEEVTCDVTKEKRDRKRGQGRKPIPSRLVAARYMIRKAQHFIKPAQAFYV
ncbi:terpenoid synthase [Panus rudis PR-1116 ss-1]|nr:terpenoid synthase [Panus rudis PR-1116 ss-1]